MDLYKSKYSDGKTDGRDSRRERETSRSFRNSGDTRGSRDESTTVTCSDCGTECTVPFVPRTNKPVYCSDCFRQNKPQDSGNDRYSRDDRGSRYSRDDRGSRDNDREDTEVTCADCGNQCTVPFVPRSNKPVYCSDCFRQHKPDDSRDDRRSGNDRYSRDDRGSRSSRDDRGSRSSSRRESSRDDNRSRKPRNDKFLRKQESFYSGGSDKFFETIKEKLYEILGGKVCSSCGFSDERALGISPISENVTTDNSGRGGDAASWGKYISAPDVARAELKVFCLNCNQVREPSTKRTADSSRPKSKKSKYFPR
jgi:CxxC-x17-CxxC domain-containing protein